MEIKEVLIDLGYTLNDRGKFWQTNAIYRGGDNVTALQIYKDTGIWKDHVAGSKFFPFKALIEKTLKTNNEEIINKYIKGEGIDLTNVKRIKKNKLVMSKIYPKEYLKTLLPHYKFYNDRGISDSTLKKFFCGLETEGKMYQRLVFPIINEDGEIHGLSGRLMIDSVNRPKWKHVGGRNNWIYPYYKLGLQGESETEQEIEKTKEVILVESIGDCLMLYEKGIKNVLVSFGISLSSKLFCFLSQLNVNKIFISFNNDKGKDINVGMENCIRTYLKLLTAFDKDQLYISLPTLNDFGLMKENGLIESWVEKNASLSQESQRSYILKYIEKMRKREKQSLSDSLYKNRKYLINE